VTRGTVFKGRHRTASLTFDGVLDQGNTEITGGALHWVVLDHGLCLTGDGATPSRYRTTGGALQWVVLDHGLCLTGGGATPRRYRTTGGALQWVVLDQGDIERRVEPYIGWCWTKETPYYVWCPRVGGAGEMRCRIKGGAGPRRCRVADGGLGWVVLDHGFTELLLLSYGWWFWTTGCVLQWVVLNQGDIERRVVPYSEWCWTKETSYYGRCPRVGGAGEIRCRIKSGALLWMVLDL
jgi:hypothetical protein